MNQEESFVHKTLELATEWSKLLLSDETLSHQVPNDAVIVFQIEDDPVYNTQSVALAKASHEREPDLPIVFGHVKGLAPALVSRLLDPHIEVSSL
ncbi:MAG: hypothetical protein HYZ91_01415 [Candidatus Omnitrophica bacterium]|nr:hypothetical protein [Candidatus Omnitrophota bacterium]